MRYPLPYAFARTHQLLLEEDAGVFTLLLHPLSATGAISEVFRKYPNSLLQEQTAATLIQRISAAYAG